MNTSPITIGGNIVKAEVITITIERDTAGNMLSAGMSYDNKVHVPGVTKGQLPHTYLTMSDIDPVDFGTLAYTLEKIYLSDANRQQIESLNII